MSTAARLISELRRRKVVRTTLIYAALAWGGVEVVTTLGPVLGLGEGVVRTLVVAILAGLPVAVVLSWMFDVTPDGIRADSATAPAVPAAGDAGGRADERGVEGAPGRGHRRSPLRRRAPSHRARPGVVGPAGHRIRHGASGK